MLQLPEDLALELVQYLATRPFGEVYQIIPRIQRLEPVPEDSPDDGKDE